MRIDKFVLSKSLGDIFHNIFKTQLGGLYVKKTDVQQPPHEHLKITRGYKGLRTVWNLSSNKRYLVCFGQKIV